MAFNKQQRQAIWRAKFPKAKREGRNRPRLSLQGFLCSNPTCRFGKNKGFGFMKLYPSRESTRRKMSAFHYCSTICQREHYRARRRNQRKLEALSVKAVCQWCGRNLPAEYRRGPPRKYCCKDHRRAAAEAARKERRSPASTLAAKEAAVAEAQIWYNLALSRHPDKPDLALARSDRLLAAAEDLIACRRRLDKRNAAQRRRRARANHEAAEAVLADLGIEDRRQRARDDPEYREWLRSRGETP